VEGADSAIVTRRSPASVDETLRRLVTELKRNEMVLFAVVDHSGEAFDLGLTIPETKLVLFGSPVDATDALRASPLTGLEVPMRVLIRESEDGGSEISYLSPDQLAERFGLAAELAVCLRRAAAVADRLAQDGGGEGRAGQLAS
jgi:uncharacterized protein (DUF302 family)